MLLTVPSDDGKVRPSDLDRYRPYLGDEHHPQPAVVSISQVTELGTVYSVDEIAELADAVHALGLTLHLDGARIANAVAATGARLPEMIRDAGVDVMTFGATKNGAMYGEAVVYLRPELAAAAPRSPASRPASSRRRPGSWRRSCSRCSRTTAGSATPTHANAMARLLADGARAIDGVRLAHEPAANAVFVHLPPDAITAAPGVVVLLGLGPRHVDGAVDDQLRHDRGRRRPLRPAASRPCWQNHDRHLGATGAGPPGAPVAGVVASSGRPLRPGRRGVRHLRRDSGRTGTGMAIHEMTGAVRRQRHRASRPATPAGPPSDRGPPFGRPIRRSPNPVRRPAAGAGSPISTPTNGVCCCRWRSWGSSPTTTRHC